MKKKHFLTTKGTKEHEKIKDKKKYPQMTQMDADERHEDLTGMDRIYRIRIQSHHEGLEEHEDNT